MNDAQKTVMDFNINNGLQMDAHIRLLDLQSELGELAKEHLELTDYGRSNFAESPEWGEELGDLYYSVLSLSCETGIDLDDALGGVLDKYAKRIERKQNPGSGEP